MAGRYIDVIGLSFWLPDPDDVAQLAGSFGAIKNNLGDTQQQLQALRSPEAWANWTGRAAGVFASQLSTVPGQLSQAHEAYATVTAALSSYSTGLYPVRNAILSAATEAEEAENTLQTETAELNHARQAGDHASVTYWTSRVQVATENLNSLKNRLINVYEELNGLSDTCARKINQASHDGMQSSLLGDIGHGLSDVVGGAGHLAEGTFIRPFTELVSDWGKEDWGERLQDMGEVAGVVGLTALLVVFSIGTLGVGDAMIGSVASGALVFAGGAKILSEGLYASAVFANTEAVVEGQAGSSWAEVSTSALSFVSGGIDDPFEESASLSTLMSDAGQEMATEGLNDLQRYEFEVPAVTSQTPDVVGGLLQTSGSLQGLQGLPVTTASSESSSILQPAVGVPSPATVSVQHVSISQEVGIQ
ncbi:MAG TPA: hypothetical protein VHW06_21440 [Streptosporangiaceae bacterium]|jgi:hypothetical protein|nr:hypothetical protein [Streptosporangiaceae bacterium]